MLEIQNSNDSYNNSINDSASKNKMKNSNINDENKNNLNEQPNQSPSNIKKNDTLKIKQRLSISLLQRMEKNPNLSFEEKAKIKELIEEIKNKDYLWSFSDLNETNKELIMKLNQNKEVIANPEIIHLPDSIDFDIEFYKIGKKCEGVKKRYAIIKDGRLYSSVKPLKEFNQKKLKEKTQYLEGAEIINETIDEESNLRGEWSNKSKKYRIKINYLEDRMKNKYSSFFLYFDDKKELNEVNLALFNICKKDNFKLIAKNTIHNLKKVLTEGNKFYVILKILTLKSMIKKRQNTVTSEMNNSNIKIKNNYSKRNIVKKDDIEIGNSSIKDDGMPNLYAKKSTNHTNNDFQFSVLFFFLFLFFFLKYFYLIVDLFLAPS